VHSGERQSGERTSFQRHNFQWHDFAGLPTALLYEVLRFRQAIFVVEQSSPYPDLDELDHHARHLLLRIDEAIAGYLRLIPFAGEARVAIGRVAVAAPLRRRGIARRLMAEALDRCERDYPQWPATVSAQVYLAPFYESLGFRRASSPYDDYGVPHVEMVR
jgi:ElaA protein